MKLSEKSAQNVSNLLNQWLDEAGKNLENRITPEEGVDVESVEAQKVDLKQQEKDQKNAFELKKIQIFGDWLCKNFRK